MSEQKEETQKTVVSFVVGLLIGGLLVWAFSGTESTAPTSFSDDKAEATETTNVDSSANDPLATTEKAAWKKLIVLPILYRLKSDKLMLSNT